MYSGYIEASYTGTHHAEKNFPGYLKKGSRNDTSTNMNLVVFTEKFTRSDPD